jgi:chromosome segregation ATPase
MKDNMILLKNCRELESSIESKDAAIETFQLEMKKSAQEKVNDEEQIKQLDTELTALKLAFSDMQAAANELQLALADVSSEISQKELKLRAAEAEAAQAQSDLQKLNFDLEKALEDGDNLSIQNRTLLDERAQLMLTVEAKSSEEARLQNEVYNLTLQYKVIVVN